MIGFECSNQIWLVEPNNIDFSGSIGKAGFLHHFAGLGTNIGDRVDLTNNGDELPYLD